MTNEKDPHSINDKLHAAHAADLWYEVLEDSYDRDASRQPLIEYLQLQIDVAKRLDAARKVKRNEHEVPLAFNEETGRNIAFGMLAVLAACRWIDEQTEPTLNEMLRLTAVLTTSGSTEDLWQQLYDLDARLS